MTPVSVPWINAPSSKRTRKRLLEITVSISSPFVSVGRSDGGSTDKKCKANLVAKPNLQKSPLGAPASAPPLVASHVRKPSNVVATLSIPLNS